MLQEEWYLSAILVAQMTEWWRLLLVFTVGLLGYDCGKPAFLLLTFWHIWLWWKCACLLLSNVHWHGALIYVNLWCIHLYYYTAYTYSVLFFFWYVFFFTSWCLFINMICIRVALHNLWCFLLTVFWSDQITWFNITDENMSLQCIIYCLFSFWHHDNLFHFIRLGASLSVLREKMVDSEEQNSEMRRALEILVRKVPDDQEVDHWMHTTFAIYLVFVFI